MALRTNKRLQIPLVCHDNLSQKSVKNRKQPLVAELRLRSAEKLYQYSFQKKCPATKIKIKNFSN